ncbi:hypothetical protein [Mesobacillus foraminis]|nr:hypothetical protein [Mesobacillus foraminis]
MKNKVIGLENKKDRGAETECLENKRLWLKNKMVPLENKTAD